MMPDRDPTTSGGPGSEYRARSPRVSVVIPIYNGAATIARALASVFDQTFTDFEIVVVDDGSTDETPAVLAGFGDRIKVIRQANRRFPAARNAGVAASRGELIALIDHDDQWLPRKLEVSVAALQNDPGASLVYTEVIVVNEAGEESRASPTAPGTAHAPSMDEMLTRLWPIMPSTVVMRRTAFDRAGGFSESLGEDLDFWPRIREQGTFVYLPDRLVRFTFGQLYPKVLNRDVGPSGFVDLIRARYGSRADGLVNDFMQHRVRMISNAGVIEMSRGNMAGARRCFMKALSYDRFHMKIYLRIARTYLPKRVARALGGRAARGA
jgi:glycosyltransferase involved in cell wall biosynthesis